MRTQELTLDVYEGKIRLIAPGAEVIFTHQPDVDALLEFFKHALAGRADVVYRCPLIPLP